jgi:histidyl-tRNA synthetase
LSKAPKSNRLKARLPRGLSDRGPAEIAATRRMIETIRAVYERYGFEPVETPAIEYTDALGKFLPDQDRPNEGVFSFQDDDAQWLSLRYDLTAPLARYVAENFDQLPKPYRSYRFGWVFRNEKPGPGRFRQFMQFDADTVGSASPAADAEICMMAADTMEALGIPRGSYVVRVNNRKVLDGVLESMGVTSEQAKLTVLRALDKLDRLGLDGVRALLGPGRKDESGDYTQGAKLNEQEIANIVEYVSASADNTEELSERITQALTAAAAGKDDLASLLSKIRKSQRITSDAIYAGLSKAQIDFLLGYFNTKYITPFGVETGHAMIGWTINFHQWKLNVGSSEVGQQGVRELEEVAEILWAAGYRYDRIDFNPSVVRGLEYYTGPVFEIEMVNLQVFEGDSDSRKLVRFGSVGGGGRYDGLVGRFRNEAIPATGISIGVSRLRSALRAVSGPAATEAEDRIIGPVVVTVFDKGRVADYQRMTQRLREAGIRAELYLGSGKMGPQLKYADKRGAPCVVIQGPDEAKEKKVQIKDLIEGAKAAAAIASNQEWRETRPAQFAVAEEKLVEAVREVLARHSVTWDR